MQDAIDVTPCLSSVNSSKRSEHRHILRTGIWQVVNTTAPTVTTLLMPATRSLAGDEPDSPAFEASQPTLCKGGRSRALSQIKEGPDGSSRSRDFENPEIEDGEAGVSTSVLVSAFEYRSCSDGACFNHGVNAYFAERAGDPVRHLRLEEDSTVILHRSLLSCTWISPT